MNSELLDNFLILLGMQRDEILIESLVDKPVKESVMSDAAH